MIFYKIVLFTDSELYNKYYIHVSEVSDIYMS